MNYNNRYIVELTRAAVFDDEPFVPEKEIDWDYIYKKSIEQSIPGLLFSAVGKLPAEHLPSSELFAKWQKKMFETISLTTRQYNEFYSTAKAAADKGLKLLGLKGCIIRELFPVPELRTMGDYDILIKPDSLSDVKAFFEERGYSIKNDAFGIVCEKSFFYWEIFTTIEEEFRVKPEKYDELFFKSEVCENGIYTVEPTAFFLHLIIHMGKHYIGSGAGIRNLPDIAVYAQKYRDLIDIDAVKAACKEQNYLNVYKYTVSALRLFYNVDIDSEKYFPDDLTEVFVEYMLLNGIFGKGDNVMAIQVSKPEDDSVKGIRKMFFPSAKSLDYRYTYLKKAPFLLPIAWIHRLIAAIFVRKYSPVMMAKQLKEANEFSKERIDVLETLGIFEKH